jgi:hypothetical protein
MPGIDSERLGVLWRSQGEAFLQEQAVTLQADMDRLRAAYVAGMDATTPPRPHRRFVRAPNVIDLREADVTSMACSAAGHGDVVAAARCTHCRNVFCGRCILQSEATHDEPVCTECALVMGGVHHHRVRPLVAPGRPGRTAG